MQFAVERAVGANRACCIKPLVPFSPSSLLCMRQPHVSSSPCCAASAGCFRGLSTSARQRQPVVCPAYAPSLSMSSSRPSLDPQSARTSLDPQQKEWDQAWEAGRLITVKSPEQFEAMLKTHSEKLVVLMCKSHACRPCKMFTRKYLSIAQRFPDCVLAEIYGDESPDTRKMMMQMEVRVTPTFRMYRQGECVNITSGTQEKKLMRGILSAMTAAELAAHEQEIADTMSLDEADQQQAAAPAGSS